MKCAVSPKYLRICTGGEEDKKLLDIRIFEESTKRAAYKRQTEAAEKQGISNCPLCALGNNANKTRIYKLRKWMPTM